MSGDPFISREDVMRILNERREANSSVGSVTTLAFQELTRAAREIENLHIHTWPVPNRDTKPEVQFKYFVQEAGTGSELRAYVEKHALAGFRPVGGVEILSVNGNALKFFQAMSREREL